MLKNDFRYIIKKIIIGLGIFIGIFYFKSCNVKALENEYYPIIEVEPPISNNYSCRDIGTTYNFVFDDDVYNVEYRNTGIYVNNVLLSDVNSNLVESQPSNSFLCRGWSVFREQPTGTIIFMLLGSNNHVATYYVDSTTNQPTSIPVRLNKLAYDKNSYINGDMLLFRSDGVRSYHDLKLSQMTNNCNVSSDWNLNCVSYSATDYYGGTSVIDFRTGFPNGNATANDYFYTSDFTDYTSVINSINAQPILSDDESVLLGFNFTLDFTNFNTDNYVYKYRVGDSRTLVLSSNNYNLSIRNNTTLYVIVEDLEGNVVDSETFTIVGIGDLYEGEYSIDFTYKDIAPSDTENSTGLSNIINRVDIDITYLPKTNILKYQYQFVNSGGSLDPQNWSQVNNNDSKNEYTFVTHSNGTLYTRILNSSDEVVANNTFTVDSIGKTKLYRDNNNIGGIFDNIKNNIDYSGPIYSLILMPINFLNTIYNNAGNTCQRYKLGTLFNNDIYFDCVDFSDYIGSDLYHLIDILCASGVIFGISRFIKKKYNQFTSLSDNDNDIM